MDPGDCERAAMWASAFAWCRAHPACLCFLLHFNHFTLSLSPPGFPPYHSPMDKLFNRRFSRFCWVTLDSMLCSPLILAAVAASIAFESKNPLKKQHFPSLTHCGVSVRGQSAPTLWHLSGWPELGMRRRKNRITSNSWWWWWCSPRLPYISTLYSIICFKTRKFIRKKSKPVRMQQHQ